MQGSKKCPVPGAVSNGSNISLSASLNQRGIQMRDPFGAATRRRRIVPGLVPRLAIIQSALSNTSGASSSSAFSANSKAEGEKSEPAANAANRRPTRVLYNVSEDPLLRQTQMLLEASRRLREQPLPAHNVDQQAYYGCSSSHAGAPQDQLGKQFNLPSVEPQTWTSNAACFTPDQLDPERPGGVVASFGALATASATAAARMSAIRSTAANGTTTTAASTSVGVTTASEPAKTAAIAATSARRSALTITATTASIATVAAGLPAAANASGGGSAAGLSAMAASAASAASSSWLAIEELIEETAYSLSQEIPDGQGPNPLDALMAASGGRGSSSPAIDLDLTQQLQGLVPQQLAESMKAPLPLPLSGLGLGSGTTEAANSGEGLVAAVPGGDRLGEMLEDLLYSMSQDINLAATQEAVLSAATAAAAGLMGAAAELPRAAASVYRSAAEAAATAAAARAAASLAPSGGGSGGTALVVPDESQAQIEYDADAEYDMELEAIEDMSDLSNPAQWDAYDTIRAVEEAQAQAAPDYSAAAADTAASAAAAATAAAAPGSAATDSAMQAVLPPIISASAAPSLADAATATAMAVVEAATTAAAGTVVITPPPSVAPPPPISAAPGGDDTMAKVDGYGFGGASEDVEQLDELTAALQNLLTGSEALSTSSSTAAGASASGLEAYGSETADALAAAAAGSSSSLPPDGAATSAAEAALSSFTEALRRELGAVVASTSDAMDTDPSVLAESAGQAVRSAMESLSLEQQISLSALPQDLRLSTLLGATLQSALDLVETALSGIRTADSTLVGGVTITAVLAVLIRSLVSMAGSALSRSRDDRGNAAAVNGSGANSSETATRLRPVGVTALEAAAALNNDPQALLVDIRNGSDVREQGLPDLRPFRRGAGATAVPLPYCDFRTTPTLANPSGSIFSMNPGSQGNSGTVISGGSSGVGGSSRIISAAALVPMAETVTVAVDPQFCSKFKQLEGLNRDSRVFLIDSYGVEAPEAVLLLRSDSEVERLLGAQGVKFVEGGFAGPEGWKLTGLPVADAPVPVSEGADSGRGRTLGMGLDLSGLMSSVAGLRLRYPSLFNRALAVGAVGGAGLAVASSLDWGAVSRGAVGLAAAMLITDRALPQGTRPSGRIRQYLQSQLAKSQLEGSDRIPAGLAAARRRTALLLRALDLAEAVGDAVVRAGGAAVAAAGSAAKGAIAARNGTAEALQTATIPVPKAATDNVDEEAELETSPPPAAVAAATTIVIPHGMDSPRWKEAAELAVAQGQQQAEQQQQQARAVAEAAASALPQKQTRSASPLRPNWRLGSSTPQDSSSPSLSPATAAATAAAIGSDAVAAAAAAAAASSSDVLPLRSSSPSLAGRLGDAFRNAAGAVVRAASPSRTSSSASATTMEAARSTLAGASVSRSSSGGSSQPDTLELMAALATASALSNVDSGLIPGWPAISFPKASAGQVSTAPGKMEAEEEADRIETPEVEAGKWHSGKGAPGKVEPKDVREKVKSQEHPNESSIPLFSSLSAPLRSSNIAAEVEAATMATSAGLWSTWRQELEAVPPPPPVLSSVQKDEEVSENSISGIDRWNAGDGQDATWYSYSANVAAAASPLGRPASPSRWGISTDDSSLGGSVDATANTASGSGIHWPPPPPPPEQQEQQQQQYQDRLKSRKVFRTSSPERAAAAGAALRRLRMQMDGLDDDGLGSGTYGNWGPYDGQDFTAAGRQFGAAGATHERMASGGVGPSTGDVGGQQQQEPWLAGAAGVNGRQKQPLRTASPQRAAAAAAAMRQLRAEMGLPPNDGRDLDSVFPRNWRREADAAAAGAAARSIFDSEMPGGSSNNNRNAFGNGRSSSNGSVPADWRARIEGGGPIAVGLLRGAGDSGDGGGGGNDSHVLQQPRTISPGKAKLTAAERAARDARLQDWRARA